MSDGFCIRVRVVETGEEFSSISAAAAHFNLSGSGLSTLLRRGGVGTFAGFHWEYAQSDKDTIAQLKAALAEIEIRSSVFRKGEGGVFAMQESRNSALSGIGDIASKALQYTGESK